jgi:hypothetical protein
MNRSSYVTPQVRVMKATEILETLGPVSAGSEAKLSPSGHDCSFADALLGTDGC